jgi:hypothetical protein
MHNEFALMVREAVLAADPQADDQHVNRVVAGVAAHAEWKDLTWLSRDLASGSLASSLAARAQVISTALKNVETNTPVTAAANTDEAQAIRAAFDLSDDAWRKLPPEDKLRLRAGLADKQAEKAAAKSNVEALKAKAEAGTLTPTEKLTLARLTEEPVTKAKRRDPVFIRSQQERASTTELLKLIRGHEQIYASGNYPQVMRDDHKKHADRLRAIIATRENASA